VTYPMGIYIAALNGYWMQGTTQGSAYVGGYGSKPYGATAYGD
jgi:hypothetical protein